MPARLHKGGSAGSPQTQLSRDWADYSQGGDAGRREKQGHLSEPPQAVADPFPEPPVEYRGPDAAKHLLKSLQEEESKIKGVLADPEDMRMTREDWLAFRTAETCHVCDKPLEGDSVRDHCHITGEYREAAHNLKLRLNPSILVVFHNLRGYDSYLLMQDISKMEGRVSCIANNTEKYISFSLGHLRLIDSAQFLLASLDNLVAANPPGAFQITARHEPNRKDGSS